ncbi:Penicillin-binding protein 4* [Gemmata sp. SH-PL17]|nr:Penicillin-binding protein 4* [Gemmata sp. SH-PL17]
MHHFSRRSFLASTALIATGGLSPSLAQTPDVPMTGTANENLAPFDSLFADFITDHKIPGASVAITRAGKLVYARGFGYAKVAKKVEVQPDAPFRIASVSKPITGAAVAALAEQGKVKFDDPVLKYVKLDPFLPGGAKVDERWAKITVRQCLQHTGGWDRDKQGGFDPIATPCRIAREMKLPTEAPAPNDIVRYMLGRPLDFAPGSKMVYSNLGYLVLGRVIEAVTGQKYEAWVQKNILAPAGARGMSLGRGVPEKRAKGEVCYYDSKKRTGRCLYAPRAGDQVPRPDGADNIEGYEAHGGWIGSAIDLVRFAAAFDYGKKSPVLSTKAITEMWARPDGDAGFDSDKHPRDAYYGCGWSVRPVGKTGKANTWHNGLIPGTSSLLVRRWDGLNWAVLFNTDATAEGQQPSALIDELMHATAGTVKQWPENDLSEKFSPREKK